jgi:hypothetical protein
MENLNHILRAQAIGYGLCKEWTNGWDMESDAEMLIEKYKKGLDFCIEHDYPSNAFIEEHFSKEFLLGRHIFVNEHISIDNCVSDTYVIQGSSCVDLVFRKYAVASVWVRHNSVVNISVRGNARVFVFFFDDSNGVVRQFGDAKVFVKKKSPRSIIKTEGVVSFKDSTQ